MQRFERTTQYRKTPMSMEQAQGLQTLANQLEQFSNQQQDRLDAQHENQLNAYVQDLENDVIENVSRLSIEHANDYGAFSNLVEQRKQATLKQITNPTLKQEAENLYAKKALQYGEKVYRTTFDLQQQAKRQQIENDLRLHNIDTQSMLSSAIRSAYDPSMTPDAYVNVVGPALQQQRSYMNAKLDSLGALNTKAGLEKRSAAEKKILIELYSTAVLEEAMIAEENGASGAGILFEFDKNPSKFFNDKAHLAALFPEQKIQLTEGEQAQIMIAGAKKLNLYREDQERIADAKIKAKEDESSKQYAFMLQNHVQTPGSITNDMVIASYNNGSLTEKDHNTLLKVLQGDSYYKEDDAIKIELNEKLFDPTYDQFTLFDDIRVAVEARQISPITQGELLGKLRSGTLRDIKKMPYYTEAFNHIKNNLKISGPGAILLKPGEAKNISLATDELYNRVVAGEKPQDIWQDILTTYKPDWNKTQDADGNEAKRKELARQRKAGEITKEQFHIEMKKLRGEQ